MNRSIVIFVALAILIAHSLAIRTDLVGDLAPPYDQAYVAYRVARNLVFEGQWNWAPGVSGFDSHPSTLWVLVCALGERLSFPINTFVRTIGVLASASSLLFATRFHSDRTASLITPMLLAISGAMAAVAVSGTETALFTAIVTGAFLAYEHRHDRSLTLMLVLCGWMRGEGWIIVGVLLAFRLVDRRRASRGGEAAGALWPFVSPLIGFIVLASMRYSFTGRVASPWMLDLIDVREGEIANGLAYVRDFFVSSVSPCLIIYCLWYLMRRFLTPTGKRALILILVWIGLVILQGGGVTPFSESMVPILPIMLIAGQEGLIMALNSSRAPIRALAWASFLVAVLASVLASSRPQNIGPIPFGEFHREWMTSASRARVGLEDQLGRVGLDEETEATRVLREIALFMRNGVDPRHSVLSPWPGSLAYLSGLPVHDMTGRATSAAPNDRPIHAPFGRRTDVVAVLEAAPDYIVTGWKAAETPFSPACLAGVWAREIDRQGDQEGRVLAIVQALEDYEWITVPLRGNTGTNKAVLLRRRDLKLAPQLTARLVDGELTVEFEHHGHSQLADLVISGVDDEGQSWFLDPTGSFVKGKRLLVRSSLLITETGERKIQLFKQQLPPRGSVVKQLQVVLENPGARQDSTAAMVGDAVILTLP